MPRAGAIVVHCARRIDDFPSHLLSAAGARLDRLGLVALGQPRAVFRGGRREVLAVGAWRFTADRYGGGDDRFRGRADVFAARLSPEAQAAAAPRSGAAEPGMA